MWRPYITSITRLRRAEGAGEGVTRRKHVFREGRVYFASEITPVVSCVALFLSSFRATRCSARYIVNNVDRQARIAKKTVAKSMVGLRPDDACTCKGEGIEIQARRVEHSRSRCVISKLIFHGRSGAFQNGRGNAAHSETVLYSRDLQCGHADLHR